MDYEKAAKEVTDEMTEKLDQLLPHGTDRFSIETIKTAIISISVEVCQKMLEKTHFKQD